VQSIGKSLLVLSMLCALYMFSQNGLCEESAAEKSATSATEDKTKTAPVAEEQKAPTKETGAGSSASSSESPGGATSEKHPLATDTPPVTPALDWKSIKPGDRPPPPDFAAAEKLYNARKFALAQKEFQKYIALGLDDVKTHFELAYCYYYQKIYSKAQKEFEWVAKNAKLVSMKNGAASTARTLQCYRAGVCPGNCLKANDPRWQHLPGKDPNELWIKFPFSGGWNAWSQNHIGQVVEYVNGKPENKGTCPICGGTGTVAVLKDGAPLPQ